jgi:hypothetical protein
MIDERKDATNHREKFFSFFYDSAGYRFFWRGLSRLLSINGQTEIHLSDDFIDDENVNSKNDDTK